MLHFREVFSASRLLRHVGQSHIADDAPGHGHAGSEASGDAATAAAAADAATAAAAVVSDPESSSANLKLLDGDLFDDDWAQRARLRVVGQEPRHSLLFTWDGLQDPDPSDPRAAAAAAGGTAPSQEPRTFIGLFDTDSNACRKVYMHSGRTNVVHASINRDATLLAFTTLTRYEHVPSGSEGPAGASGVGEPGYDDM